MKNLIKKIDKVLLRGHLVEVYISIKNYLLQRKITPLPRNIKKDFSLSERLTFFKAASYYLQTNRIDGVYMEFGCHEANTFRMALNILGKFNQPYKISKFIAFDSFEGMPKPQNIDKQKIWRAGLNHTTIEKFNELIKKDIYRVEVVKGFYENSLKNYNINKDCQISLAYIDCDYYESTKCVLNFLEDKISHGSIIFFDDWNCYYCDDERGQRKALTEFRVRNIGRFKLNEFYTSKTGGKSFIINEVNKIGSDVE